MFKIIPARPARYIYNINKHLFIELAESKCIELINSPNTKDRLKEVLLDPETAIQENEGNSLIVLLNANTKKFFGFLVSTRPNVMLQESDIPDILEQVKSM
jgi:hypothetical protein